MREYSLKDIYVCFKRECSFISSLLHSLSCVQTAAPMNDSIQMPLKHHTAGTSKILAIMALLVRQGRNFFVVALGALEMEEYRLYCKK